MHVVNDSAVLFFASLTLHTWRIILLSAVAQWLLGALWFGVVFRKSWRALAGFAEGQKPKNSAFGLGASFVANLLLAFVLAHLLGVLTNLAALAHSTGPVTFAAGARLGIICWLGFLAPPLFTQHIFENRRANLFAINAGYWLLAMALGGGILAAFHG